MKSKILPIVAFLVVLQPGVTRQPNASAQSYVAVPQDIQNLKRQSTLLDEVIEERKAELKERPPVHKPVKKTPPKIKVVEVKPEVIKVYYRYNGYVIEGKVTKTDEGYYLVDIDSAIKEVPKEENIDTLSKKSSTLVDSVSPKKKHWWKRMFKK